MNKSVRNKHLLLFDIDGTLTKSRLKIQPSMIECLNKARKHFDLAIVGGSDRDKQIDQLGDITYLFNYAFSENGTLSFKGKKEFHRNSFAKFLGENKLKELINFCLQVVIETDIPVKRGTFLEYRNGMLNCSVIGRNCTQEERMQFVEYNKTHDIQNKVAQRIRDKFDKDGVYVSVGGQISVDIFPKGWDKTYCLQFIDKEYEDIHFFGDKVYKGGNDFEIYEHERTIGHDVKGDPEETIRQIEAVMKSYGYN